MASQKSCAAITEGISSKPWWPAMAITAKISEIRKMKIVGGFSRMLRPSLIQNLIIYFVPNAVFSILNKAIYGFSCLLNLFNSG